MTVLPSSITQMAFDLGGAGVCSHAARHATSPATRPSRKDSLIHEPPARGQRSDLSASRWRRLAPCSCRLLSGIDQAQRHDRYDRCSITSEVVMPNDASFADQLKAWRGRRGLAQLALAGRAGISQRHLSFLELGRASPSREMVDRLAGALDLPLRQHNTPLPAAGVAPAWRPRRPAAPGAAAPDWRQRDLAAPDLADVTRALDYILAQQEPYPAVVIDRHWNLLRANAGAVRLVEFLVGPVAPGTAVNLADALVAPDVLRPYLVNWTQVVRHFIRSVEADARADGLAETATLLERLTAYHGVRTALNQPL